MHLEGVEIQKQTTQLLEVVLNINIFLPVCVEVTNKINWEHLFFLLAQTRGFSSNRFLTSHSPYFLIKEGVISHFH